MPIHRIGFNPNSEITFDPTLVEARIDLKLDQLHYQTDPELGRVYRSGYAPYFIIASNPDTQRRRIALFDPNHLQLYKQPQKIHIVYAEGLIAIQGALRLWVCKRPGSLPEEVPLKDGRTLKTDAPDRARVIASWIQKFLNLEYKG